MFLSFFLCAKEIRNIGSSPLITGLELARLPPKGRKKEGSGWLRCSSYKEDERVQNPPNNLELSNILRIFAPKSIKDRFIKMIGETTHEGKDKVEIRKKRVR